MRLEQWQFAVHTGFYMTICRKVLYGNYLSGFKRQICVKNICTLDLFDALRLSLRGDYSHHHTPSDQQLFCQVIVCLVKDA